MFNHLGLSSTQDVHHHLHDGLVHAERSHQVRMLVEDLVIHDVTADRSEVTHTKHQSLYPPLL